MQVESNPDHLTTSPYRPSPSPSPNPNPYPNPSPNPNPNANPNPNPNPNPDPNPGTAVLKSGILLASKEQLVRYTMLLILSASRRKQAVA